MDITNFADVYEYALAEIDDIRLFRLNEVNPALYLYRLWDYIRNAIPQVSHPKGIQEKLCTYKEPVLNQFTFEGDGETTVFTVSKDADCLTVSDKDGEIIATIIPSVSTSADGITYDATAGTATFDTAPQAEFIFNIDLYTDGYFGSVLNIYEMNIIGSAFRYVWFSKIANTFLRNTPKIKDKNFNMDSSWGVEQADTARLKAMKVELNDAMADYERYLAYKATVPMSRQLLNSPALPSLINRLQSAT